MGSSPDPAPPTAPRKDHAQVFHGRSFADPYYWLREKGTPDVEKYLEAENAYVEATSADLKPFSEALYQELLGRIKQTDLSVPTRIGRFYYYRRTVEGLQYPIRCRKPAGADGSFSEGAPEQVLLDQNEMAKDKAFLAIGEFEVSDDASLLLFSTDEIGFRQYKLFVKDLGGGDVRGPLAERVTSATWAADNQTVFYLTEHPVTKRSDTLWRQSLGGQPVKLYDEPDELYSIGVYRTKDKKLVVLGSRSTDTWEARLVDAAAPAGELRVVLPREKGHRYEVEHRDGTLFIRTNKDAKNFRLVKAPLPIPRRSAGSPSSPTAPDVLLQDVDGLQGLPGAAGAAGRPQPPPRPRLRDRRLARGRLPRARLRRLRGGTPEFESKRFRYNYQSLVTPSSVFDYDTATRPVAAAEASRRCWAATIPQLRVGAALGHRARRRQGADSHRLQEGPRARRPAAALLYGYGSYGYRHARHLLQPRG